MSVHFLSLMSPPSLAVCLSFFTSLVSLPFSSLSLSLAVLFVAYRQSLFHSLRVFEKHPLVVISENVVQKRHSCHTDMILPDRTFVFFFSFLLLSFLLVFSSLSSSITRAKRLDVLSVLSSTSWWLLVDFPFHIHVWSLSLFSLSFTFVALGEELETNRAYTTHFTSLIRNNS